MTTFFGTDLEDREKGAFLDDKRECDNLRQYGATDEDILAVRAAAVLSDFAARQNEWPLTTYITAPSTQAYIRLSIESFGEMWRLELGVRQGKYGSVEIHSRAKKAKIESMKDTLPSKDTLVAVLDMIRAYSGKFS